MEGSRPTILILTTRTGGGHLNLAQSLKGVLDSHYNVVIANPQSDSVERNYTQAMRHFTKLLEWQFIISDNALIASCVQHEYSKQYKLLNLNSLLRHMHCYRMHVLEQMRKSENKSHSFFNSQIWEDCIKPGLLRSTLMPILPRRTKSSPRL
jgi:hypothetical protein